MFLSTIIDNYVYNNVFVIKKTLPTSGEFFEKNTKEKGD
jgi:hypothetical protein